MFKKHRKSLKRLFKRKNKKTKRIKNKKNKKFLKLVGGGIFDDLLAIVSNNDANMFDAHEIQNEIENYEVGKRYLIKIKNAQSPGLENDYFYLIEITEIDKNKNSICFNYVSKNKKISNPIEFINITRSDEYIDYFIQQNILFAMSRVPGLRTKFCIPISYIEIVYSEETPQADLEYVIK